MVEKVYFSIKEVSEMLQLPPSTLRYWEREVEQLQPRTNAGKTRFYSQQDIVLLRRCIYLRSQNIPLKDWSKRLQMDERGLDKKAEARANLIAIREELVNLRNLL